MDQTLVTLAGHPVTVGGAALAVAVATALLLAIALLGTRRGLARRAEAERASAAHAAELQARLAEFARTQNEMSGRMQTMAEVFGSRQSELVRGLSERMDGLGHRIGQSMTETTKNTHDSLSKLNERLAVIDTAQRNITDLSSEVVQLQRILANKQTRGAFGQARMEAIIQDGLPGTSFTFQATLSNGRRPDCLVTLPNGAAGLVIDAKFPLEAWSAIRAAEGPEALKGAQAQFRRDTLTHIKAIRERYFITGETQDTAFMFVPSESIFADLHEHFDDMVQQAYRLGVVIVSPSLLMLSIQVIQALLKDARMREQAHIIRDEVGKLMADMGRLDDRVRKLQSHFGQTTQDVEQILVSTRKLTARGERIEALDLEERPAERGEPPRRRPELVAGE